MKPPAMIVGALLLVLAGGLLKSMLPDITRYLKMKAM